MITSRIVSPAIVLALIVATGCGSDGDTATGGSGGSGGSGATGGAATGGAGGSDPYAALYSCAEDDFQEGRPLSGVGFDPAQGGLINPKQTTYVVSTTQIYISKEQAGAFYENVGAVVAQLTETPGLVALGLATDDTCGVNRTLGVWESEEAMYTFAASGAHAVAMENTPTISLTGKVTHWTATVDEVNALDWDVARAKIAEVDPSYVYE